LHFFIGTPASLQSEFALTPAGTKNPGQVTEFPADKALALAKSRLFFEAHALASDTTQGMENTPQKVCPYQRAVLFLHVNAWRAKICEWCGRRFVGEHSQARFCTYGVVVDGHETTCYWAHRKKYQKVK